MLYKNTMTLQNKIKIINRRKIEDKRGWFLKIIDGLEENLPEYTGEFYLTSANPGETKGEHFHNKANEWFTLIKGKCLLRLYDIDEKEYAELSLDEGFPQTVFIPKRIAHSFENITNDNYLLLAYTDLLYDPIDTISFILKEK
jgi:dTDP-4-dehydrorhamnose 3,5-epimerase-like enzyme